MPSLTWWNLPIYVVAPVVMIAISIILYRRGWIPVYRVFFTYLIINSLTTLLMLPLAFRYSHTHDLSIYKVYFYTYWSVQTFETLLIFIVLYRIFRATFAAYETLRHW